MRTKHSASLALVSFMLALVAPQPSRAETEKLPPHSAAPRPRVASPPTLPEPAPEPLFIDKGACPGEGCHYSADWVARDSVKLHRAPGGSSTVVALLEPGARVETLTGEVHTRPGRFVVHRAEYGFAPGDEVLVYTYLGEGFFNVRHNGQLKEAVLGFGPHGGTAGKRCEASPSCWGTLASDLEFDWWVQVRGADGTTGWTKDWEKFDWVDE